MNEKNNPCWPGWRGAHEQVRHPDAQRHPVVHGAPCRAHRPSGHPHLVHPRLYRQHASRKNIVPLFEYQSKELM